MGRDPLSIQGASLNNVFRFAWPASVLVAVLLVAACAIRDKTTLDASWVSPQRPPAGLGKVLIITVSGNEFVQAEVQDQLAAKLQARGVNAVASHRYFTNYAEAERQRFRATIEASDADTVLVARVTTTDTETRDQQNFTLYMYPTQIRTAPDYTLSSFVTQVSLFDRKTEKLIWSGRTRTVNAGTGDRNVAVAQYVSVVINAMVNDKVI
jgi:hypothetical protein